MTAWATVPVEHDGLVLDVHLTGPDDGPPVVLLHGFPQSALSWRAVGARLAAAGLRVLAPDQRGYSPGARPAAVDAYALERLTGDVLAVTDDLVAPGAAVHLVGHDWGACVAWRLAVDRPERVRTLTALSIPHLAAFGAALAEDEEQQRLSGYIGTFRAPGGVAERALAADGWARFRALFDGVVATSDVQHYVSLMEDGALTPALAWYRAMDRGMDALGPVAVPTTYAWGEADRAVAASGAHATAAHVDAGVREQYRFVPLAGVSHWLPDEVPDLVADLVVERVTGRRGGSGADAGDPEEQPHRRVGHPLDGGARRAGGP